MLAQILLSNVLDMRQHLEMKRHRDLSSLSLFLLSLLGLVVWMAGCGGMGGSSGGGAVPGAGSGARVIVVVNDPAGDGSQSKSLDGVEESEAAWEGEEDSEFSVSKGTVLVKPAPTKCTLIISAPDMTTITKEFNFSRKVKFDVTPPAGNNRKFDLNCIDTNGTTQNITVGYEATTTLDVTPGTTTVNLTPKYRNLIGESDADTTLQYIRFNQPNGQQTRVTFGFGQILTSAQLITARCILEFDTPGTRDTRGVIDTTQTTGLVVGAKSGLYFLLTGGLQGPKCELYDQADNNVMAVTAGWQTNADGNTEGTCTFGITQMKTNVDLDQKGQFAGTCSITGTGNYDSAPNTGYAKYDLSPNTQTSDRATLVADGGTCSTSRSGETCASGYCFNGTCMNPDAYSFGGSQPATNVSGTGNSGSTNGALGTARHNTPSGLALDKEGRAIYVADRSTHIIRKIDLEVATSDANYVTTYAGTGTSGTGNGSCGSATFNNPRGVTVDPDNQTIYVAQGSLSGGGTGSAIRSVTITTPPCGVTTLAGSGIAGFANGVGTAASFRIPLGMAIDSTGNNLYVSDSNNHLIRQVVVATQNVISLAGGTGANGLTDGFGTASRVDTPAGIAIDPTDTYLYIADQVNGVIRRIGLLDASVTRLTLDTTLVSPLGGMAVDPTNTYLYVTDQGVLDYIYRITISSGAVLIVASTSTASINAPVALALDPEGNKLYFADTSNHRVQSIP